jgi:hypothetical protein
MSGMDDKNYTVRIVAATFTVTENDYFISVQAPAALVVANIPAASAANAGREYVIQKDATATQTVTITPASGNIDGGATKVLAAGALHGARIFSDGAAWWTSAAL